MSENEIRRNSTSDKGWLRVQIEPFDVPVDPDGSVLLSTVQSVVPGAHGLFYRNLGQRRAIRYDSATGRLTAPESGWFHDDIFVYLAHGHRPANCQPSFENASKQFQQSVAMVQKLIAGGGIGDKEKMLKTGGQQQQGETPLIRMARPYMTSSGNAQSEEKRRHDSGSIGEELNSEASDDSSAPSINGYHEGEENGELKAVVDALRQENDRLKRLLSDNRYFGVMLLECFSQEKSQLNIEHMQRELEKSRKDAEDQNMLVREQAESLRQLGENIDRLNEEKDHLIANLEKLNEEAVELRTINKDEMKEEILQLRTIEEHMEEKLKEQAVKFEEELKAVQLERDALRDGHRQSADEREALKLDCERRIKADRENLEEVVAAKECDIGKLEWHLGEHRQWLSDEKRRTGELEVALRAAHDGINHKQEEIDRLNDQRECMQSEMTQLEAKLAAISTSAKISVVDQTTAPEDTELRQSTTTSQTVADEWPSIEGHQNQSISELQNIIAALQEENKENSVQRDQLRNLKESLLAEIDQLTARIDENQDEIAALRQKNKAAVDSLEAKEKCDAENEWHLGEHRQWLDEAKKRITELENEKADLANEIWDKNQNIDALNDQLREYRDSASKWSEKQTTDDLPDVDNIELQPLHDATIGDEEPQHHLKLNQEMQSSELFSDSDSPMQHIDDALTKNRDLQSQLTSMKEEIERKNDEINHLQEQISNQNERGWEIQREIDGLRQKCLDAEIATRLKDEKISEHEWHLGEHRQWLNDARTRIAELETASAKHIEEIACLAAEKETLNSQLETMSSHSGPTNYDDAYEAVEEDVQEIESDQKPRRKRHRTKEIEAQIKQKDEQIADQERHLGEHRKWLDEAKKRVSDLEDEIKSLNAEFGEKNRIIEELRGELTGMRVDCERLQQSATQFEDLVEQKHTYQPSNAQFEEVDQPENLQRKIGQEKNAQHTVVDKENRDEALEELRHTCIELEGKLNDMTSHKEFLEHELENMRQTGSNAQHDNRRNHVESDAFELTEELMQINKKKYHLEEKVKVLEAELQRADHRIAELEGAQNRRGEEIWLANESLANQGRHIEDLQNQLRDAHSNNERLKVDLQKKFDAPDDFQQEIERLQNTIKEEREKMEWRIGEITQWWNDAKWRVGELEAENAEKRWLLDQAQHRIHQFDDSSGELSRLLDRSRAFLHGAFIVRKQPYVDRDKWKLAIWGDESPNDFEFRRVWFEIDVVNARHVYLMGSFFNWECGLLCNSVDEPGSSRRGVWVDIPVGRHEFRYFADGHWITTAHFPTVPNEFGSLNNVREVE